MYIYFLYYVVCFSNDCLHRLVGYLKAKSMARPLGHLCVRIYAFSTSPSVNGS